MSDGFTAGPPGGFDGMQRPSRPQRPQRSSGRGSSRSGGGGGGGGGFFSSRPPTWLIIAVAAVVLVVIIVAVLVAVLGGGDDNSGELATPSPGTESSTSVSTTGTPDPSGQTSPDNSDNPDSTAPTPTGTDQSSVVGPPVSPTVGVPSTPNGTQSTPPASTPGRATRPANANWVPEAQVYVVPVKGWTPKIEPGRPDSREWVLTSGTLTQASFWVKGRQGGTAVDYLRTLGQGYSVQFKGVQLQPPKKFACPKQSLAACYRMDFSLPGLSGLTLSGRFTVYQRQTGPMVSTTELYFGDRARAALSGQVASMASSMTGSL